MPSANEDGFSRLPTDILLEILEQVDGRKDLVQAISSLPPLLRAYNTYKTGVLLALAHKTIPPHLRPVALRIYECRAWGQQQLLNPAYYHPNFRMPDVASWEQMILAPTPTRPGPQPSLPGPLPRDPELLKFLWTLDERVRARRAEYLAFLRYSVGETKAAEALAGPALPRLDTCSDIEGCSRETLTEDFTNGREDGDLIPERSHVRCRRRRSQEEHADSPDLFWQHTTECRYRELTRQDEEDHTMFLAFWLEELMRASVVATRKWLPVMDVDYADFFCSMMAGLEDEIIWCQVARRYRPLVKREFEYWDELEREERGVATREQELRSATARDAPERPPARWIMPDRGPQ